MKHVNGNSSNGEARAASAPAASAEPADANAHIVVPKLSMSGTYDDTNQLGAVRSFLLITMLHWIFFTTNDPARCEIRSVSSCILSHSLSNVYFILSLFLLSHRALRWLARHTRILAPPPPSHTHHIPFRTEINLGRMVGEGGFCRVTEISSVDLDEVYDTSEEDAVLRRGFAREVNDRGPSGGSLMSEGSGRGGGGRSFVLKTLRGDLPDDELEKGIVDLAIEAEFLAVLSHPNVIAMRAMANSDPHSGRFFVVLDRLTQTLDKKFNYWRKIVGDNAGYWFPLVGYCCAKTPTLHAIWKERMAAVLNIALAIQYLHSLGIVYRDLKPDNIGFDFSGGLKVRIATAFLQRPSPRSFPYFLSEFSLTHMSTRFLPLCKLFVDSLDFRLRLGQTGRRSGANAGWPLSSNR